MLTKLRRRMYDHGENFNREWKYKKLTSRSYRVEQYNNWTENYTIGVQHQIKWNRRKNQWTQKEGRGTHPSRVGKKKKDSLWDLRDNTNWNNVCNIGVPKGKEKEKREEQLPEEIMAGNLPNLEKEIGIHIQKKIPKMMILKRPTPGHIIITNVKS